MSAARLFRNEKLREPALRSDGSLYAESKIIRADEVLPNDVCETMGTVMEIEFLPNGVVKIKGRLLERIWPGAKMVQVVRRNWK